MCYTCSKHYLEHQYNYSDRMKTTLVSLSSIISFASILSLITGGTINASAVSLMSTAATTTTTATPIKHLVVIFQENVSYDHYFGTYPKATNPQGEPEFNAEPNTPSANGLTAALLNNNPNLANPFRLDRSEAVTCDMNHDYSAEQQAYHGGLVDKFVEFTGSTASGCNPKQVMGYFDGNTVTAFWNYAQHFSMSDNFFGSTFGPSTPGAINLVSGQTHGAIPSNNVSSDNVVNGTIIHDPDPMFDDCSKPQTIIMQGKNIGDLLNAKNITWGWFQGGFKPTNRTADGKAICNSTHKNIANKSQQDYSAHHEPFQYYKSTANPHHLPPSSIAMIGKTDQANHQYGLSDFWNAVAAGNMPSVSFLKAPKYQDGHPGYSDPIDEQTFLVNTINQLQERPEWNSTAVIIAYDDSDGWYDHVMPPLVSQSNDPNHDFLFGPTKLCGNPPAGAYNDRCGYGPRLPLLVISPYAKVNFIDHKITDQTSILRFIEDNWSLGRIGDQSFDEKAGLLTNMFDFTSGRDLADKLLLDPSTGLKVATITITTTS
jgi:phospholipase C